LHELPDGVPNGHLLLGELKVHEWEITGGCLLL
jgi:hypothetical protein